MTSKRVWFALLVGLFSVSRPVCAQSLLYWDPPVPTSVSVDAYRVYVDRAIVGEVWGWVQSFEVRQWTTDGFAHVFGISSVHAPSTPEEIESATVELFWNGQATPPPVPPVEPVEPLDGITPATVIVDASFNRWTLVGQIIYRNGVDTGGRGSQLIYYEGAIYVFGTDGGWWQWNDGGSWTNYGPTKPSAVEPTNGTITPATVIVDANLNQWTLAGQVIYRNGVDSDGRGSQLIYYMGAIYVFGTDGAWWQWNDGGWWTNYGPTMPGIPLPPQQ